MQKVGDVCENCRERWERQKKEPKVLQAAANSTIKRGFKVPLCPYCDGDAVGMTNLSNHGDPS